MTTVRHVARAAGSTGTASPAYRVDLRVGTHELVADETIDAGGGDLGPAPFGLLAGALSACTAITLRMYASRKGWDLSSLQVDVRFDVNDQNERSIARTIAVPLALRVGTPINTTFTSLQFDSDVR